MGSKHPAVLSSPEGGHELGKPDKKEEEVSGSGGIELKLSADRRQACRDIVREINRFGVSQRQKLYIVYLLALELENREHTLAITDAIKSVREKLPVAEGDAEATKLVAVDETKSAIIVPRTGELILPTKK